MKPNIYFERSVLDIEFHRRELPVIFVYKNNPRLKEEIFFIEDFLARGSIDE